MPTLWRKEKKHCFICLCLAFTIFHHFQRNRSDFVFKSPIFIQPLWYMIHIFNLKLSRHFHSRGIMFQLPIIAWCKSYPGELFLEKERQFNFKFIWQPPLVLLFKMNNWPSLKHLHNSIAPTRIWVFPWGGRCIFCIRRWLNPMLHCSWDMHASYRSPRSKPLKIP